MSRHNPRRSKTGWMIFKKYPKGYHPYIYQSLENAQKQIGWFGDEVHRVRIVKVKK